MNIDYGIIRSFEVLKRVFQAAAISHRLLSRSFLKSHDDEKSFTLKSEKNLASLLDLYHKCGLPIVTT